ncbi:MAG: hypothetical protein IT427_15840 [Pirellulales bacterium]|nr:hypothetical protein [Pirellulales bacterium]
MRRAILSTHPFTDPDAGLHDKVRIDRLYYNENNQLSFEGQRWNELPTEARDKQHAKLHEFVADVVGKYWPAALFPTLTAARLPDDHDSRLSVEGIAFFNNSDPARRSVLAYLWTLVPQHEELDGIRVDRAYYQRGVLHLNGVKATPGQIVQLQRYIDPNNVLWKTLAPHGVEFNTFCEVPIQVLKSRVQTRLAANKDVNGARIRRLYYKYDGRGIRLTFEIERWSDASEGKSDFSDRELNCDLPDDDPIKMEIQAELDGTGVEWSATRELGKEPCYKVAAVRSDLLAVLREKVPDRKDMDGVRLDRAFYDPKGVLHFTGLIGRDEQLSLVEQLVRHTVAGHDVWGQYVRDGWAVEHENFDLLPIDPLLACIQHILPGYEELDGAAIARIYHRADGQLAVDGRAAEDSQKAAIGRILASELWRIAPGRRRLSANYYVAKRKGAAAADGGTVEGKPRIVTSESGQFEVFPIDRDFYKAQSMLGDAWQLYWKNCYTETIELLDIALSYDSKCVGAWYLRALCFIQLDKIPLARRDIRRAVLVNKGSSYRLNARHSYLTRVQGEPRTCFERLFHEALFSRPNGSLISELCDDCDCYGPRSRTCIHCRQQRLPSGLPCPHYLIVPGCTTCTPVDGHRQVTQSKSTMATVLAVSKGVK